MKSPSAGTRRLVGQVMTCAASVSIAECAALRPYTTAALGAGLDRWTEAGGVL